MFEVALVNGRGVAVVDDDIAEWVSTQTWYLHSKGYACLAQGVGLMHRLVMSAKKGTLVDHRDGDKLNNQRSNLRITGYSGNGVNRRTTLSLTGVPGVSKRGSRYCVYLMCNYRQLYLGTSRDLVSAAMLRRDGELEHFGEISQSLKTWLREYAPAEEP